MITLARYAGLLSLCTIAACGARDAPGPTDDAAAADAVDEAAARAVLTAEEEAAGWILLFDGVSTDGWRGYGREDFPTGDWKVEAGELVGQLSSGNMEGPDIITVAEFTDF